MAGCFSAGVLAQETAEPSRWQLNGFGTLGLVSHSDNFQSGFRRDVSQPLDTGDVGERIDSRIGFQANYAVASQWELVGQLVAKDRLISNGLKDAVEWAFVSYRPVAGVTVRVGRTSPDVFLLSDYRNVGFAYQMARPPVEFYGALPLDGLDGVDVAKSWNQGDAQWRVKAFAGQSSYRVISVSGPAAKGKITGMGGLVLTREQDGLLVRGTLARSRLQLSSANIESLRQGLNAVASLPVPSVAAQARDLSAGISTDGLQSTYTALGVSYDRGPWIASSEFAAVRSNVGTASFNTGYANLGYRVGAVTFYSTLSAIRSVRKAYADPQWGSALAPLAPVLGAQTVAQTAFLGSAASAVWNASRMDQRTVSLGGRWDIHPRLALKVQLDRTRVMPNGTFILPGSSTGGTVNVGTVLLDFVF